MDLDEGISSLAVKKRSAGRPRSDYALTSAQRKQRQRMANYQEFLDIYYSKGEPKSYAKFSISQLLDCVRQALRSKSYGMVITITEEIQNRVLQLSNNEK